MRKVNLLLCTLIALLSVVACTNLDDVYARLDKHDKQIEDLNKNLATTNDNIKSLQQLIDAQAKKLSIDSFEEVTEGYILNMSDGSKIILKNGNDGNTPNIGIQKDTDGLWYWVIDGEFMHDANGNKVRAGGNDGKDGIAPQLRIHEGYWEISTDGGKSWQTMTDENGNRVKAEGSSAEIDLNITEDDDNVYITYNGQTFIIPKKGGNKSDEPTTRPKLPIEYFAEYDLAPNPDEDPKKYAFVTTHANDAPGMFQWGFGIENMRIITINGKAYRVPTANEMHAIVSQFGIYYMEVEEGEGYGDGPITVLGETLDYETDFKCTEQHTVYAIRFKGHGDKWLSAYRYQYKENPESAGEKMLEVRVRYLGPESTTTIDDVAVPEYWETDGEDDVIRIFPATGWLSSDDLERYNVGTQGSFFTKDKTSMGKPISFDFQESRAYMYESNQLMDGGAVRLIEDY